MKFIIEYYEQGALFEAREESNEHDARVSCVDFGAEFATASLAVSSARSTPGKAVTIYIDAHSNVRVCSK